MNTKKFIGGGLIAGVVYFLLGWLVFGVLLADSMRGHMNETLMRKDTDIVLWAIIIGNFSYGFLLSYLFQQMGVQDARRGSAVGAVVGLITSITFDFSFFGTSTMYKDLFIIAVNVSAILVISALSGLALGAWLRKTSV